MRVIAGSARGVRLAPVPAGTRPMADRAREGLYSSLGPSVQGARVLDLFAGTGAMGIEALSRGAETALFVDSSPAAAKVVTENLRRTRLAGRGVVRRVEALAAVRHGIGQFDLVLLDPPYRLPEATLDTLLGDLAGQGVVAAGGTVVLTRPDKGYMPVIPVNWRVERRLSYGDAAVLVLQTP
jgi:16S rRNA (guanine966-N2)-methyltransferase